MNAEKGRQPQTHLARLAARARGLHAAERHAQISEHPAVDPDSANLRTSTDRWSQVKQTHQELVGDAMRARTVTTPDAGSQAILIVVGASYSLILGGERQHANYGPEDLFLHAAAGVGESHNDSGGHIVSL